MKLSYPEYYTQFRCIAAKCPDSCCKEWEVDIDGKTAAIYRGLPGALGDRLRQVLRDTEDGTVMAVENGRCPMWRSDGLCRIQAELGHEALSEVCRAFPRLRHEYGDFTELGLELSCPEAARLILSSGKENWICEEVPGGEPGEYDEEVMSTLRRSRKAALDFLEDERFTLPEALAVLLLYGYAVQNEIDGGEAGALMPDAACREAYSFAKAGDMETVLSFFRELEILTPQWKARLSQRAVPGAWQSEDRNLIRYFIRRYWLQAVADYDLVCRVKLTVIACLLIHALGGALVETAQLFSKEIENDPENLEAILEGAYSAPAFTDVNLLGLLLRP